MTLEQPVRIHAVEVLREHVLRLTFSDGSVRDVDVAALLHGPVFAPMRASAEEFRRVFVDAESGTVAWPNGADICPDVLYHGRTPAWMAEASDEDSSV